MAQKKSGSPRKRRSKGPRIAQHLPKEVQALLTRCLAMWAAIKADTVRFTDTYPPPAEVEADLKGLSDALQAAEGGDPVAIAALHVAEEKVRQTFGILGKYAEAVVRRGPIEDAPAIISNILMFESQIGRRAPKPELEPRQGPMTGLVLLIALAVRSAVVYYWEISEDQQSWKALPQTTKARTSVSGLTPGKVYYFRFYAFTRDAGMTDPSQAVHLMVI